MWQNLDRRTFLSKQRVTSKTTIARFTRFLAIGPTKVLVFLISHFGGLRTIDPLLSAISDRYGLFLTYDATKLDSNPINLSNREASDILKIQLLQIV